MRHLLVPRETVATASALSRYLVGPEDPFGAVSRRGCSFWEAGATSALIFPAEAEGVKRSRCRGGPRGRPGATTRVAPTTCRHIAIFSHLQAVMGVKKCSPGLNHPHSYPQAEHSGPPRSTWIVQRQSTVGRKRSQPCLASSCFWHFPPRHKLRQSALMRKWSAIASLSRTPAYRWPFAKP